MTLEVIGPGFGRTGTHAMKLALEHLGLGPCHHMFEVRDNAARQLPLWQAAAGGETIDWEEAFAGYRAQTDWPGARYWRELAGYYPDAKVILTVRDPDAWFDSVQATIAPLVAARGTHPVPLVNDIAEMGHELVVRQVFDDRLSDRAHATAVFRRHVAAVRSEIEPERLLVMDVREGWEPLCTFLCVPVPEDMPFPRTNSSKAFTEQEWKRD